MASNEKDKRLRDLIVENEKLKDECTDWLDDNARMSDEIAALRAENDKARRVIERVCTMLTPAIDGSRAVERARAALVDYLTGSVVTQQAAALEGGQQ